MQANLPLFVLFGCDNTLAPQVWLNMWKQDLLPNTEKTIQISTNDAKAIVSAKLQVNNIAIVAERVVDGQVWKN